MTSTLHQGSSGPFLESPETVRAIFRGHNSLFISRTEGISVVKLHSQFAFCYLENMLKDQPSKKRSWQFLKWLFGPEKFSGLSKDGPQILTVHCPFESGRDKAFLHFLNAQAQP